MNKFHTGQFRKTLLANQTKKYNKCAQVFYRSFGWVVHGFGPTNKYFFFEIIVSVCMCTPCRQI